MNLFLLAGHPCVELVSVLVTPGTPAQLLLVHEALNKLAEDASLPYLNSVPLGYSDIDHEKSQDHPVAAVSNKVYANTFPQWLKEVNDIFGPSGQDTLERTRQNKKESRADSKNVALNTEKTDTVNHKRLKDHVLDKLAKEGREQGPGWKLMIDLSDRRTVLMTGGPVKNLGRAIEESLKPEAQKRLVLGRWAGQGGFAGANVIPEGTFTLEKFRGKETCATFNFDASKPEALAALQYEGILERFLCSKNVCHQVVFDKDLESRIAQHVSEGSLVASQNLSVLSSLGLPLFHEMMSVYKNASDKKLHDLVAGLCAIDPAYSGCSFRRAQLELIPQGTGKDKKVQWGCRHAVGPAVWPRPGDESQFATSSKSALETNVWISVDVDLGKFKHWLVGYS
jgi:hypothetical protein